MPIYEFECKCGNKLEIIQAIGTDSPTCSNCGGGMAKMPSAPAMVKMAGAYGSPAERKWNEGTAPFTNRRGQPPPWQEGDPKEPLKRKRGRKWLSHGVLEGVKRNPEAKYGRTKEEILKSLLPQ